MTLASRVAIAAALRPKAFVSVHHNAEPDGTRTGPGQRDLLPDPLTRLEAPGRAGLRGGRQVAGRLLRRVDGRHAMPGPSTGPTTPGGDYYGILRRSGEAGVVASLAELAFISNPSEEAAPAPGRRPPGRGRCPGPGAGPVPAERGTRQRLHRPLSPRRRPPGPAVAPPAASTRHERGIASPWTTASATVGGVRPGHGGRSLPLYARLQRRGARDPGHDGRWAAGLVGDRVTTPPARS